MRIKWVRLGSAWAKWCPFQAVTHVGSCWCTDHCDHAVDYRVTTRGTKVQCKMATEHPERFWAIGAEILGR